MFREAIPQFGFAATCQRRFCPGAEVDFGMMISDFGF